MIMLEIGAEVGCHAVTFLLESCYLIKTTLGHFEQINQLPVNSSYVVLNRYYLMVVGAVACCLQCTDQGVH